MTYIKDLQNYDLQVLYVSLADELDFFKNTRPSNIIQELGDILIINPSHAIQQAHRLRFKAQLALNSSNTAKETLKKYWLQSENTSKQKFYV